MVIIILSSMGVLLFVIGVSYIFRGYLSTPAAGSVVPRSEWEALKQSFATLQQSGEKERKELITLRTDLENATRNLEVMKGSEAKIRAEFEKSRVEYHAMIDEKDQQLIKMATALDGLKTDTTSVQKDKQAYEERIKQLEAEVTTVKLKATEQAQGALELVESLKKEKEDLQKDSATQQQKNQELQTQLAAFKNDFEQKENELKRILLEQTAQAEVFRATTATLKEKTIQLEQQLSAVDSAQADKLKDLERLVETLKKDHESFQSVDENNQRVISQLKSENTDLRQASETQVQQSAQVIEKLKSENEVLKSRPQVTADSRESDENNKRFIVQLQSEMTALREKYESQIQEVNQVAEKLKKDNEALKSRPQVAEDSQKLKEMNVFLLEKEKVLQRELLKSRAQAMGLERICADLKAKFETTQQLEEELRQLRRQVSALQKPNEALSNS